MSITPEEQLVLLRERTRNINDKNYESLMTLAKGQSKRLLKYKALIEESFREGYLYGHDDGEHGIAFDSDEQWDSSNSKEKRGK